MGLRLKRLLSGGKLRKLGSQGQNFGTLCKGKTKLILDEK